MKRVLCLLLLSTATGAYACEWRLTITNLITNELKFYKPSEEPQAVDLANSISKEKIRCVYHVIDVTKSMSGKGAKRVDNAYVGCFSNDGYLNQTTAARVELKSGYTNNTSAIHEVINVKDEYKKLYNLRLSCE